VVRGRPQTLNRPASVLWPTGVFVGYNAGPGWDPVTGWGSPDAQFLVPLLAHAAHSGA
jgi:hypothetical protein